MLPFIKDGKLKVLGVAGIERSNVFPYSVRGTRDRCHYFCECSGLLEPA